MGGEIRSQVGEERVIKVRRDDRLERVFGRLFFSAVIVVCLLLTVYRLLTPASDGENFVPFYLFVGAIIIGSVISFRLSSPWQTRLAVIGCSIIVSIYIAEFGSFLMVDRISRAGIARATLESQHIDIDTRRQLEVVRDLKAQGVVAYPSVFPSMFRQSNGIPTWDTPLLPLTGVANATIVMCNEVGNWEIIQSDEYGFTNPPGLQTADSVDIVLLGDSFANGWCVPEEKTVASQLRKINPSLLNLGVSGSGPLAELGLLVEYAEPHKPKVVLWFYFEENDFKDILQENKTVLSEYLAGEPHQQLRQRQDEIDEALKIFFEETNYQYHSVELYKDSANASGMWRLANLGTIIKNWNKVRQEEICEDDRSFLPLLRDVLTVADEKVSSWDGRLIFVYLPDVKRFQGQEALKVHADFCRDDVLAVVNELGLPLIDMVPVLAAQDDPLAAYPYEFGYHFTEFGYQLLADQIIEEVDLDPAALNEIAE